MGGSGSRYQGQERVHQGCAADGADRLRVTQICFKTSCQIQIVSAAVTLYLSVGPYPPRRKLDEIADDISAHADGSCPKKSRKVEWFWHRLKQGIKEAAIWNIDAERISSYKEEILSLTLESVVSDIAQRNGHCILMCIYHEMDVVGDELSSGTSIVECLDCG